MQLNRVPPLPLWLTPAVGCPPTPPPLPVLPSPACRPQLALTMIEPKSGRGLHILSTTPAMVLYAPGGFNMKGKEGLQYPKYGAVALEMVSQRQPGRQGGWHMPVLHGLLRAEGTLVIEDTAQTCSKSAQTCSSAAPQKLAAPRNTALCCARCGRLMLCMLWSPHAVQTMFPDAVNQPNYPSQILRPGGEFRQQIVWRFFNTPASTGSGSQGSCLAKFPGCKQCKGGKCTACTCSSDIPDPKTSKVGRVGIGQISGGRRPGGALLAMVLNAGPKPPPPSAALPSHPSPLSTPRVLAVPCQDLRGGQPRLQHVQVQGCECLHQVPAHPLACIQDQEGKPVRGMRTAACAAALLSPLPLGCGARSVACQLGAGCVCFCPLQCKKK
jgi:hypothetical protein